MHAKGAAEGLQLPYVHQPYPMTVTHKQIPADICAVLLPPLRLPPAQVRRSDDDGLQQRKDGFGGSVRGARVHQRIHHGRVPCGGAFTHAARAASYRAAGTDPASPPHCLLALLIKKIGNLWEVGSHDIDRFTKELLTRCHGSNVQLDSIVAEVRNHSERNARGKDEALVRNATTRFAVVYYGVPMEMSWAAEIDAAPTKLSF